MFVSCEQFRYAKGEDKNMAIVIDGIIGAGKTTIGHMLSQYFDIKFYEEIKSEDEATLTQRMLDRFYASPERWSAIIQLMFLNDRFRDIKLIEATKEYALLDRSIYGDEIFARTIFDRGQMTEDEFSIYSSVLTNMLEHIQPPELLIYIDVTVDTAMKRIKKRSRSTEADAIPKDYLEDLRKNYELWYEAYNLSPKIKIDLNDSMFDDDDLYNAELKDYIIKQVQKNIKSARF